MQAFVLKKKKNSLEIVCFLNVSINDEYYVYRIWRELIFLARLRFSSFHLIIDLFLDRKSFSFVSDQQNVRNWIFTNWFLSIWFSQSQSKRKNEYDETLKNRKFEQNYPLVFVIQIILLLSFHLLFNRRRKRNFDIWQKIKE